MKELLRVGVLSAALAIAGAGQASASTIVIGNVGAAGDWGLIEFVHAGGALTIDFLGNGWTGGPTGMGIDDGYLTLLVDDGSSFTAFTGAHVASNDDSGATLGDGSTSFLDSFISLGSLAAGEYLLTISHCCVDFSSNRDINLNSGIHDTSTASGFQADFQVTFDPDVVVTAVNAPTNTPVPEPASMLLLGSGLVGAAARARRKKAAQTT